MNESNRKQQIDRAYNILASSAVHKEYKSRLMFVKGWSQQSISAKLRKVAEYFIDHPDSNLPYLYAGAFGLTVKGVKVPNLID